MHICHIVLNNIGGAPKVADSLISSQAKTGYKVSTVILTDLDPRWILSFKSAHIIIVMKIAGTLFYIGGAIHQIWVAIQLNKIVAEQKPDIIICHSAFLTKLFYLSKFIPGSLSIPYISYIHSDYLSESKIERPRNPIAAFIQDLNVSIDNWIHLRAIKQASGIVFVCKTLHEKFLKLGLNHPRIAISYNPVTPDSKNISLNSTAESWLNDSQLITFVSAARFHYPKDHQTLIKAFAKASETYSNIRLVLLGDGDLEVEMQDLANSLGIRDIVLFAGSVPNPKAYFSLCRAVILASHSEGFGMVLVEAVANGVTFIASDCPVGPREISEVLNCGTIVAESDVDALAEAIIDHVKSPPQKIDRSEQIAQFFSETSCANQLESLIQQIFSQ